MELLTELQQELRRKEDRMLADYRELKGKEGARATAVLAVLMKKYKYHSELGVRKALRRAEAREH